MENKDDHSWLALIAVCMGFFVIQLDVTIVNVALPAIQHSVGGSVAGLQWVIDAYTVALASIMLVAGVMGDRLGSRRLFLIGLGIFMLSSAACAIASTLPILIAARTVQGIGAAILLPCSLALIVHQFPNVRERAGALGIWGGIASLGMASGPVLGGVLVSLVGWRTIFIINVPLYIAAALLTLMWVDETPKQPESHFDLPGVLLGVGALGCLSGGFIETGQFGWASPLSLGLLALGALLGIAFVWVEHCQSKSMLPSGIFQSPAFSAAVGIGVLFNFCLYGTLLCLSLFLQHGLKESAFIAGMAILPLTVAVGVGAIISGPLTARFGPRLPMIAGMASGAVGAVITSIAGASGPLLLVLSGSIILGLCSLAMPAMTSVAVGA